MESLQSSLAELGADGLPLPGIDEPMVPASYVRAILSGGRDQGWDFDRSWAAAINRLQPVPGTPVDIGTEHQLREERAMLEEVRGYFRAGFEQREPTSRERAEAIPSVWRRIPERLTPQSFTAAAIRRSR